MDSTFVARIAGASFHFRIHENALPRQVLQIH